MNKDLETQLVSVLSSFQENLGQAKDFTLEQAPLVIQEYILMAYIESFFIIFLCVCVWIFSYLITFHWVTQKRNSYEQDWSEIKVGSAAIGGCISFIAIGCFFGSVQQLLLLHFAPKVFLLQTAASLIKG